MQRVHGVAALVAAVLAVLVACGGPTEPADGVAGGGIEAVVVAAPPFLSDRNGGPTTARALRGRPFNQSARNLSNAGLDRFAAGAEPFDQFFTESDGLGPEHDRSGCLSCHLDGTEAPDEPTDAVPPGLIVRISLPGSTAGGAGGSHGAPREVPTYGLQLQPETTAADGDPEASVAVRWRTVVLTTTEGRKVRLRRPALDLDPHRGPLPGALQVSARMAQTMIGLGLLEAVPDADLAAAAAAQAAGDTGVSGRVNHVTHPQTGATVVGRFGWKAGQPSVASQTLAALHNDLGLTTPESVDAGVEPEMDAEVLGDLIFYNQTIAVPISRDAVSSPVRRGAATFERIGCAACHTPTQRSDAAGGPDRISAVADITFHPYTDLLLHDMGTGLSDGRPEFEATAREWRTAPLWGLSRRVEVTGVRAFLHDGRARTPEEAILWHDGEGRPARLRFERLSPRDRRDLLAFLDSL